MMRSALRSRWIFRELLLASIGVGSRHSCCCPIYFLDQKSRVKGVG